MKPAKNSATLLEPAEDTDSNLFKELLLSQQQNLLGSEPEFSLVKPEPGFCLKTKNKEGKKVFINFCHSSGLPAPKDITEKELEELLARDTGYVEYRVPLSLGEPKEELSKSGEVCIAHDVVINTDFYQKCSKSFIFKNFVIQVAIEGLEDKTGTEINKQDFVILKNRKYLGTMTDVPIRSKPVRKPLIQELESGRSTQAKITEIPINQDTTAPKKIPKPKFQIIQDPPVGHPDYLVATFELLEVRYGRQIDLDLGEDRIVLSASPHKYFLDIFLPYLIDQEESGAQFDTAKRILTLTMKVKATSS